MRLLFALLSALALAALPALAAWNDPNVAGAQEYRLIKFYPQARVAEFALKDYDSARMLISYNKDDNDPAKYDDIEGKVIEYRYEHKPTTSTLEILRNYENTLRAKGFETILSGKASAYPGLGLGEDDTLGYFRWDEPGKGMVWVYLHAYYNGGHDSPESKLVVVETKPMEQSLQANSDSMMDALQATGRVAVYGITFDTAKATLRPDAEPILNQVRLLLTQHADLRLAIEGHTDSVGQPGYNQKLSADRAASVKAWLAAHGVDGARLETAGFGDTKPVDDNGTDDGRAKNRRVELVRQ